MSALWNEKQQFGQCAVETEIFSNVLPTTQLGFG
jgi:hypothetical protein